MKKPKLLAAALVLLLGAASLAVGKLPAATHNSLESVMTMSKGGS